MGAQVGLFVATFVAALVEFTEALTIVLAMGLTRGWRSTLAGVAVAVAALAALTAGLGYALATWLPRSVLELVVGVLLLVFGLQWLRKAVLRSAGRLPLHDETAIFAQRASSARVEPVRSTRFDPFGFTVALKGVFLEGAEVVFIVITFGLNAGDVPVAVIGAAAAGVLVLALGALLHRPLAAVPENTLKYVVGLLLTGFGTFWSVEGLSVFGSPVTWPGGEWMILVLVAVWYLLTAVLIRLVRRPATVRTEAG